MEVQKIPKEDIDAYAELFWNTFTQNADKSRLDFVAKIKGTSEIKPIPLGCYDNGKLVAATTIFPITFEEGPKHWLGGQIGDALVSTAFRGKGMFNLMITEAQDIAAKEGYDFLFTFPSVKNPGSYKSFVKNGWKELYPMSYFEFQVNSGIIGRLIRKLGNSLYLKYEEIILPGKSDVFIGPKWRKEGIHAKIDTAYVSYKRYLKNYVLKLKSGLVYVSLSRFAMTLSHFELTEENSFEDLLLELRMIAARLAKDTLRFYAAPFYEEQFSIPGIKAQDQYTKAMVFPLNEDLDPDHVNFIGSDIDTF